MRKIKYHFLLTTINDVQIPNKFFYSINFISHTTNVVQRPETVSYDKRKLKCVNLYYNVIIVNIASVMHEI